MVRRSVVAGDARAVEHPATELTAVGGSFTTDYGKSFYQGWGDPGHTLTLPSFAPTYRFSSTRYFTNKPPCGPKRGHDVRIQQRLSLKDAVLGCKREISVRAPSPCETCDGSGAAKGASRKTCPGCGGAGQVSTARGFVMFTQTCPECRGEGSVVKTPCPSCNGQGAVEKSRKVLVTFPAGVDSGLRLRVPGQGMPGSQGGPAGDLYVDIEVAQDERFERDGADLVTRATVSFAEAALGGAIKLDLPDDTHVTVDVPAGTQPGEVITVKNKGAPRLDGRGKGALQVVMQIDVPRRLSSHAKDLLKQLQDELRKEPEKVKSA